MLVSSPRHTPEDLACWRTLERADLLNYGLRRVAKKAERSLAAIREFAAAGTCYCSVSWGKDSTVLAHLVAMESDRRILEAQRSGQRVCETIPLAWVTVGELDAGCRAVRDHFLALFPSRYEEVEVAPGERTDRGTRGKRAGFRELDRRFGPRRLVGIRADESAGRRTSLRRWGLESPNSCRPLGWWSADDVFAYLAHHGLPAHPNYAMLGGGSWDRLHLRTAPVGGLRGEQYGRTAWEKEYYPDLLRLARE